MKWLSALMDIQDGEPLSSARLRLGVALFDRYDDEISGAGYTRQIAPFRISLDGFYNEGSIEFGPATSCWKPVMKVGFYDLDKDELASYGPLDGPIVIEKQTKLVFDRGGLNVRLLLPNSCQPTNPDATRIERLLRNS